MLYKASLYLWRVIKAPEDDVNLSFILELIVWSRASIPWLCLADISKYPLFESSVFCLSSILSILLAT